MKHWWFAVLLGTALAAHAQTTEWRLATGYREETFHTENLVQFARDVAQASAGRLQIAVHPNNTLVRLADIPQAVREGRIEAGETILSNLAQEIPLAGADSVPFVVGSYADALRLWRLQRPLLEQHFARRGLTLLYAVPWPPQGLFTQRPLRGAGDFRGTHMRTYNPATVRIAELLGAVPVDVPMVEVNRALEEGRIDNMITSAVTGVENRVWGAIGHYYEINAWFPKNVVFVRSQALAALAPAQRQAVLQAAQAAELRGWARSQAVRQSSTEALRAHGIRVDPVPAEFEGDIRRLGERFSREWVRLVGNEANALFVPYYTRPDERP